MTMSDTSRPESVATGHLVLTTELRDRIQERLLGLLDSATRRLSHADSEGEERADPGALIETIEGVQAALVKLDAGYYGVCETCEGPIPIERLDALPAVRTCASCQARPKQLVR